jgi:hypothetical protein
MYSLGIEYVNANWRKLPGWQFQNGINIIDSNFQQWATK